LPLTGKYLVKVHQRIGVAYTPVGLAQNKHANGNFSILMMMMWNVEKDFFHRGCMN
jgi:hypothetical protein